MDPSVSKKDIAEYSLNAQEAYKEIFAILESKVRDKMKIREASDAKILEQFECSGNISMNPYIFQIRSFAPDTSLLNAIKVQERLDKSNIYSIGLLINIGHFYIVLAGDVEERTIKAIPQFNIDVKDRIDYLKIPHHASSSSSYLIDKFIEADIEAPSVAASTVYRSHNLPDKKVLKKYYTWGKETKIYVTGDVESAENDHDRSGVIKTIFDITEKKDILIETALSGNAVCVAQDI